MSRSPASILRRCIAPLVAAPVALALALGGLSPSSAAAATVGADGKPITNAKGVQFATISHRGGADLHPENSVEAYRYSVAEAFDVIETDLLFTRDGHGVMTHNDTLPARCTSAGKKIHQLTLTQVRAVRCADLAGRKRVPIPTFAEFAAVVAPSDIGIELDLKTYSGQPASGERRYAERAIKLLKKHGLLERASILTFHWSTVLPTIRKLAPRIRVVGLDNRQLDLGRVRLAASLGLDGFGIRAADSPVNLLRYIKAKGMDPTPWEVKGTQLQAYSIYFGGKVQGFRTDDPAMSRADLVSGRTNIDPVLGYVPTTLSRPVTIVGKTTLKANKRRYPKVMGTAVPWRKLGMLDSVRVKVTVTNGPGKGYLSLGAADSAMSSSVKVPLPKGTGSVRVSVPVGTGGKLRAFTTRTATVRLQVVGYTNLTFS